MTEKPLAELTEVKTFFNIKTAKEMRTEWKELSDDEKREIRELIAEL